LVQREPSEVSYLNPLALQIFVESLLCSGKKENIQLAADYLQTDSDELPAVGDAHIPLAQAVGEYRGMFSAACASKLL